eukprot:4898860-Heterocapsa_arctica.AAC.1
MAPSLRSCTPEWPERLAANRHRPRQAECRSTRDGCSRRGRGGWCSPKAGSTWPNSHRNLGPQC